MKLETSSSDGIGDGRSSGARGAVLHCPRPDRPSIRPDGRGKAGRLVNRTLGKFLGWIFSSFGYAAGTGGGPALNSGGGKTHEGVMS